MPLHGGLSAKCTGVLGVLCDFHLLYLLSEGGAISDSQLVSLELLEEASGVEGAADIDRSPIATHLVPYFPVTPTSVPFVSVPSDM